MATGIRLYIYSGQWVHSEMERSKTAPSTRTISATTDYHRYLQQMVDLLQAYVLQKENVFYSKHGSLCLLATIAHLKS